MVVDALGLESGADDYLVKSFALRELVARIRALTRRHMVDRAAVLKAGPVVLDTGAHMFRVHGREVRLTAKEFTILEYFLLTHGSPADSHSNPRARLAVRLRRREEPGRSVYMARVFQGQRTILSPILRPNERLVYWLTGVREDTEQGWLAYTISALALGAVTVMLTFVMLRLQDRLPLNPQGMAALKPDLAANTAISFTSNTGWENYVGEQTLSYLSQMGPSWRTCSFPWR